MHEVISEGQAYLESFIYIGDVYFLIWQVSTNFLSCFFSLYIQYCFKKLLKSFYEVKEKWEDAYQI